MAKVYGVISTKGGTGKTTLCANTGAILADLHQKTLIIDTDPQGSLSRHYPLAEQSSCGLSQLITTADPNGCISKTVYENLDIIQSDDPKADRGGVARKKHGIIKQCLCQYGVSPYSGGLRRRKNCWYPMDIDIVDPWG